MDLATAYLVIQVLSIGLIVGYFFRDYIAWKESRTQDEFTGYIVNEDE